MSLGPVDLRQQRLAGALLIALLAAAVAAVLLLSGRSLGSGVAFSVRMRTPGALRVGAKLLMAGHEVGEVRAMRYLQPDARGERYVLADCFVVSEWAPHVHGNSDIFVNTPSILGEAFLEVGPPRHHAQPGPPVEEGDVVRGADPPELDQLLQRVFRSTMEGLFLLREHRTEIDELLGSMDSVLDTLSGIPVEKGQLGRIRNRLVAALDDAAALWAAEHDSGSIARARTLARDLAETIEALRPELRQIGERADRAAAQVSMIEKLVGQDDLARFAEALRRLGAAARHGERIAADLEAMVKRYERGEGSIAGLLHDKELFDDLHETHRLLKWKAWRLIKKTPPGTPTAPE